jgi:hypothetical protein
MRRAASLVFIILCGIAGLWGGYWLGHLAGWSENANWPGQIGGGAGAILLGVVLAVVGVAVAAAVLIVPTYRTTRRLLRNGTFARATVLERRRAALTIRSTRMTWDKVCCQLNVQPAQGASFHSLACQFMTAAEQAALLPDTLVDVRYNPKRPRRVAIVGPVQV